MSKSKLEANREIFDERRLTELLEYKQPTQQTSEVKKGTLNVYWGGNNLSKSETSPERVLSNLAKRQFTYQGRKYGSVEHAYQSNKSGIFNQITYDRYNKLRKTPGYGKKISSRVSKKQLQDANSLTLMKNLVVESFKQNHTSSAAKVLMQYEDFTHNGLENKNEIDKARRGLASAKAKMLSRKYDLIMYVL